MAPYLGYDSDTTFIPGTLNTSSSLYIQGGGITQTGGDVNLDSGTLFIDEDLNRVGIGITSPSDNLHVYSTSSSTSTLVESTNSSGYATFGVKSGNVEVLLYASSAENAIILRNNSNTTATALGLAATRSSGADLVIFRGTRNVVIGNNPTEASQTGTANQKLQVQSGAYISGNVGIGTTNPLVRLHIQGSGELASFEVPSASSTYFSFTSQSTKFGYVGSASGFITTGTRIDLALRSNNNLLFSIGNAEKLRLNSSGDFLIGSPTSTGTASQILQVTGGAYVSGNVGIGTTNPTTKLHVDGITQFISDSSAPSSTTIPSCYITSGNSADRVALEVRQGRYNKDVLVVSSNQALNANLIRAHDNGTDRFVLTGAGAVGIGTGAPISTLHVQGTFRSAINSGVGGDTLLGAIIGVSNGYIINANSSNNITHTWHTGSNVAALRINNDGNVGISTTNPSTKLHVYQGSGDNAIRLTTAFGTGTEYDLTVGGNGNYSPGVFAIRYNTAGTTPFIIEPTGHVTPGADATQNLGSATKRWANVYSADLQLSNEGSANDIDGTWGAYTIQEGEEALYLINRRSGKKFKFVLEEVK